MIIERILIPIYVVVIFENNKEWQIIYTNNSDIYRLFEFLFLLAPNFTVRVKHHIQKLKVIKFKIFSRSDIKEQIKIF